MRGFWGRRGRRGRNPLFAARSRARQQNEVESREEERDAGDFIRTFQVISGYYPEILSKFSLTFSNRPFSQS